MGVEPSATQRKRAEKVERLRRFFGADNRVEIYEWDIADESLDFSRMSDQAIEEYLKNRDSATHY
jgi:hypothetical protein